MGPTWWWASTRAGSPPRWTGSCAAAASAGASPRAGTGTPRSASPTPSSRSSRAARRRRASPARRERPLCEHLLRVRPAEEVVGLLPAVRAVPVAVLEVRDGDARRRLRADELARVAVDHDGDVVVPVDEVALVRHGVAALDLVEVAGAGEIVGEHVGEARVDLL